MTAQETDTIHIRDIEYALCSTPLDDYLRRLPKARREGFRGVNYSTSLWRGYVARWAVRDGLLWLEDVTIPITAAEGTRDLRQAAPWLRPPVLARWFTGQLRCIEGRILAYVHMGFGSVFERDRLLWVERGRIIHETVVVNQPPPLSFDIDPATGRGTLIRAGSGLHDDPTVAPEISFDPERPLRPAEALRLIAKELDRRPHLSRNWGYGPEGFRQPFD